MTKFKAVIFDYGGVVIPLVPSAPDIAAAYGISEEEIKDILPKTVNAYAKGEISEKEFWIRLSANLGKPVPSNWQRLWSLRESEWSYYWPTVQLIKGLRATGIKTFVLSNTIDAHSNIVKSQGGFAWFDGVFLSHEVGLYKPDSKFYEYVLNEIKIPAPDCIYIDDMPANLIPPQKLGMHTILATHPLQVVAEVNKLIFPL